MSALEWIGRCFTTPHMQMTMAQHLAIAAMIFVAGSLGVFAWEWFKGRRA